MKEKHMNQLIETLLFCSWNYHFINDAAKILAIFLLEQILFIEQQITQF